MIYNIPKHDKCINCGYCCGVIPVNRQELETIQNYIAKHPEVLEVARREKANDLTCPFRDDRKKQCAIYPVRPVICRLFGVVEGMNCPQGNSHNLNGFTFIDDKYKQIIILNKIDW